MENRIKKRRYLDLVFFTAISLLLFTFIFPSVFGADPTKLIDPEKIILNIKEGDFLEKEIIVFNPHDREMIVLAYLDGNISEFIEIVEQTVRIPANSNSTVILKIMGTKISSSTGDLRITGGIDAHSEIILEIRNINSVPINALYIEIESIEKKINPGKDLKYKMDLQNLLSGKIYNVTLSYNISRLDKKTINGTTNSISFEENVTIDSSIPSIRTYHIEKNYKTGLYKLSIKANYLNLTSSTEFLFDITNPFYNVEVKGIKVWQMIVIGGLLIFLIVSIKFIRIWIEKRKRYHIDVDYKLLPKSGARSAWVGLVSETKKKSYIELDDLTTHSIVAGATGRGKSIAAQDIMEEALMKGIAIIVFDPTAQWSGMLRKCESKKMFDIYPRFGMKKSDAKGFNGNVRQITNSREIIKIRDYIKPGEIQIFSINKLQPNEIDVLITNAIKNIFDANFDESQTLDVLLVFDEVHRLLPKFGSSGNGFIQIERACREFRKWGIGLMLVSQVLADFVGEIKANINTEVQLRTGDEGDLNRIKTKYGGGILKSLIKASVGTAMVQNSNYNRGKPYFVSFRPIMHAVRRLSDEELDEYNKYNEIIDDTKYQLEQLKEEGEDIFDKQLELKLAKDKLKTGNFQMVDIYLEGLTPSVKKVWENLGKTPKRRVIETISEEDLQKELEKAKKAREAHEAKQDKKPEENQVEEKEVSKFEMIIQTPLTLDNGAMISSLNELIDVMETLDEETFELHVNDEKNDISKWIREEGNYEELANKLDETKIISDMISILNEEKKQEKNKQGKKKEEKKKKEKE